MKVNVLKGNTSSQIDLKGSVDTEISDYAIGVLNRVARQNLKQGTKLTKGRSEVRGRSAKPFRQKGTGNARQGSKKGPHMRGGGIAHGPTPDYHKLSLNRKFKQIVLKKVLSKYANEGNLGFIDFAGEIKELRNTLSGEKTLIVVKAENKEKARSLRNLPKLSFLTISSLSPLNTLSFNKIYFDLETKERVEEILN